jgi:hypothetical protein
MPITDVISYVEHRVSCPADEAACKMIGWMLGPIYERVIGLTEKDEIPEELYINMPPPCFIDGSIKEMFAGIRQYHLHLIAKHSKTKIGLLEKQEAFATFNEKVKRYRCYLMDIEEEIAKGQSSALIIDRDATDKSGETHITFRSIDRWSQKKYGIAILAPAPSNPEAENSLEQSELQSKHKNKEEADSKGRLSKTMANNLYTTFAFLVEAFASSAPRYNLGPGKPNVSAIAAKLQKLAADAAQIGVMAGQSAQSIQDRIEYAMHIKKENLPANQQRTN